MGVAMEMIKKSESRRINPHKAVKLLPFRNNSTKVPYLNRPPPSYLGLERRLRYAGLGNSELQIW